MRKFINGITVIYEPTVELISENMIVVTAVSNYFNSIGMDVNKNEIKNYPSQEVSPEQAITEMAARTCYQSFNEGRPHREHVQHLAKVKHWSVFEHNNFTFALAGISRTLTHELVRHRHMSFSQLSQRYVDHTKHNLGFVVPPDLIEWFNNNPIAEEEWIENRQRELKEYQNNLTTDIGTVIHRKRRRQAARNCLPGCMETRMVVSGNARTWLEACMKRCPPNTTMEDSPADLEIWRLFDRIKAILMPIMPDLWHEIY